jgi:hypothetical protein
MVLDGHVGHLLFGRAVLAHVGPGHEREDSGEGEADGLFPGGVGAIGEILGRRVGWDVQHPLGAPDHDDIRDTRGDLHDGVAEGRVARGARVLETGGGDGRYAQERRGERAHVQLLFALTARDVAVVQSLDRRRGDVCVADGVPRCLGEELAAGAVVLPEFRDAYTDDGDAAH